ncbi:MAG: glycosyltransferase family 87 protein, partial [Bacteroidia bacterium]
MKEKNKIFSTKIITAGILLLIVIVISVINVFQKPVTFSSGVGLHTHYNNFLIFRQSFFHLKDNKDLYQLYPNEHWDLYKYSPAFALLMAPFAYLPDALGLIMWNALNVFVLFFAIWKLPFKSDKTRLFAFGFILIELITSIQNSQSNGLIAGLIVLAFVFLEKKNIALASLFIVLTIFIKIFGLVALALFIFYPNKLKATIYTIAWILLLAALPLLIVSVTQLSFLYHSWLSLLQDDHSASLGISVAGWLYTWFGIESKNSIVIIGVFLFCLPLINYRFFNELRFKLFYLSSILIWIIIFNHKAESPTFVIAVSGIAIWFFSQKMKTENLILLILAFILTVLSPTDL